MIIARPSAYGLENSAAQVYTRKNLQKYPIVVDGTISHVTEHAYLGVATNKPASHDPIIFVARSTS